MNVKKKKILTVGAFAAIAAAVYAVVLFMNYYTPLTVDDFCYHTNFATKEMLSGLSSIVESMRFHYHYTNGRIIPHTIVQLLAYYAGKDVFNFINAAVFTALGFLIYKISNYKKPSSPVRFLFIYVLLFLFVPAFGQTALWFDGSVNYLWGTAAAATLLYFFHTKLISPEKYTSKLFFALSIPLAFLAGGWSENTSAVLWMLEVLYGCLYLWTYRKKLPLFYIADFVVSTASWLIMITAPANAYRKAKFPNAGPIETLRSGMNNCMFMMRRYLYAFLFMMLLLLILAVFKKASDNRFTRKYEVEFDKLRVFTSFLFLLGSLTANFVMAVAPYASLRLRTYNIYDDISLYARLVLQDEKIQLDSLCDRRSYFRLRRRVRARRNEKYKAL